MKKKIYFSILYSVYLLLIGYLIERGYHDLSGSNFILNFIGLIIFGIFNIALAIFIIGVIISLFGLIFHGFRVKILKNKVKFVLALILILPPLIVANVIKEINITSTEQKAEKIIEELNNYKTDVGYYPDELQTLIPKYIDILPKTENNNDFGYYSYNSTFVLYNPDYWGSYRYDSKLGTWEWRD